MLNYLCRGDHQILSSLDNDEDEVVVLVVVLGAVKGYYDIYSRERGVP